MIEGIDARDFVVIALCISFVVGIFWANRNASTEPPQATEEGESEKT